MYIHVNIEKGVIADSWVGSLGFVVESMFHLLYIVTRAHSFIK